ncbi:thiamine phosphate synthase [Methanorbis rubei]|uniref:Thiamine-phosphate synthase n=1 Tax=Methanorbis rubei TaxID=3028300 RepID=A0AAE4SD43_9EURY|nr:Thiamine-phosphate synthase [Methanocorpusculaceae archaeon Cs1]
MYDLYVVTDEALSHGLTHEEIARRAVAGGANIIQLRDKEKSSRELYEIACKMKEICRGYALFIVNDRVDVALAAGADGVHLGQSDLPIAAVRKLCPKNFLIGISVGSVEEAKEAEAAGADYVAVSPVFSTSSKSDAGAGHGIAVVRDICSSVMCPVIGIGGINAENTPELIAAGLDGVAVISAVVSAPDVTEAARELSLIIKTAKENRS